MTSLILGALLSMNTASADITVRVTLPWWNRHHRHHAHCSHRPPVNPHGQWVFVPGHWEYRGQRRVWVHGHWRVGGPRVAPPPAHKPRRHRPHRPRRR
jgi:hypothetical protein